MKYFKKLLRTNVLFICLLGLSVTASYGQFRKHQLKGKVISAQTRKPIANATITATLMSKHNWNTKNDTMSFGPMMKCDTIPADTSDTMRTDTLQNDSMRTNMMLTDTMQTDTTDTMQTDSVRNDSMATNYTNSDSSGMNEYHAAGMVISKTVNSNSQGRFVIKRLHPGMYMVTVTRDGYQTGQRELRVKRKFFRSAHIHVELQSN